MVQGNRDVMEFFGEQLRASGVELDPTPDLEGWSRGEGACRVALPPPPDPLCPPCREGRAKRREQAPAGLRAKDGQKKK